MFNFIDITKIFDGIKTALKEVNFSIKKNTIHAFIGPNGAGKTTLMKILMRAYESSSGKVLFEGKEIGLIDYYNQKIGFMFGLGRFTDNLKVEYFLKLVAKIRHIPWIFVEKRLVNSGLNNFRKTKCSKLSTGWRKILLYFVATLQDPKVLVLDEPTSGLDFSFKTIFLEQIKNFCRNGGTVFISSHILSELEDIADNITFINYGNIVYDGVKKHNLAELYKSLIIKDDEIEKGEQKWL